MDKSTTKKKKTLTSIKSRPVSLKRNAYLNAKTLVHLMYTEQSKEQNQVENNRDEKTLNSMKSGAKTSSNKNVSKVKHTSKMISKITSRVTKSSSAKVKNIKSKSKTVKRKEKVAAEEERLWPPRKRMASLNAQAIMAVTMEKSRRTSLEPAESKVHQDAKIQSKEEEKVVEDTSLNSKHTVMPEIKSKQESSESLNAAASKKEAEKNKPIEKKSKTPKVINSIHLQKSSSKKSSNKSAEHQKVQSPVKLEEKSANPSTVDSVPDIAKTVSCVGDKNANVSFKNADVELTIKCSNAATNISETRNTNTGCSSNTLSAGQIASSYVSSFPGYCGFYSGYPYPVMMPYPCFQFFRSQMDVTSQYASPSFMNVSPFNYTPTVRSASLPEHPGQASPRSQKMISPVPERRTVFSNMPSEHLPFEYPTINSADRSNINNRLSSPVQMSRSPINASFPMSSVFTASSFLPFPANFDGQTNLKFDRTGMNITRFPSPVHGSFHGSPPVVHALVQSQDFHNSALNGDKACSATAVNAHLTNFKEQSTSRQICNTLSKQSVSAEEKQAAAFSVTQVVSKKKDGKSTKSFKLNDKCVGTQCNKKKEVNTNGLQITDGIFKSDDKKKEVKSNGLQKTDGILKSDDKCVGTHGNKQSGNQNLKSKKMKMSDKCIGENKLNDVPEKCEIGHTTVESIIPGTRNFVENTVPSSFTDENKKAERSGKPTKPINCNDNVCNKFIPDSNACGNASTFSLTTVFATNELQNNNGESKCNSVFAKRNKLEKGVHDINTPVNCVNELVVWKSPNNANGILKRPKRASKEMDVIKKVDIPIIKVSSFTKLKKPSNECVNTEVEEKLCIIDNEQKMSKSHDIRVTKESSSSLPLKKDCQIMQNTTKSALSGKQHKQKKLFDLPNGNKQKHEKLNFIGEKSHSSPKNNRDVINKLANTVLFADDIQKSEFQCADNSFAKIPVVQLTDVTKRSISVEKMKRPIKRKSEDTSLCRWHWKGDPIVKVMAGQMDSRLESRPYYSAIEHDNGDVIKIRDCVLIKSGPRKKDVPFVAKIAAFWSKLDSSENEVMMMTVLWYYRPEHTDLSRLPHHVDSELFASRHRDDVAVTCIEDICYVLTLHEYCRYVAGLRRASASISYSSVVPELTPDNKLAVKTRIPGADVSTDNVFLCRRVYDVKLKRILRNPYASTSTV